MLEPYRFSFRAMGSPCQIALHADKAEVARAVADSVIADVECVEQRYSRFRADSALSAINREAGRPGGVAVDEEMAALLDYAQMCFEQSDGLFDITSGILRRAWRFSDGPGSLPSEALIEQLLEKVGWDKLSWKRPFISFHVPGMELDFGGIAKEYAADRAVTLCVQNGIESGVVNFGGDLRVIGPHPDGSPWQVGIRHPRHPQRLLATLDITSGAVTTSGDYERCLVVDGKRYSHILNPRTGWPVAGLCSVSVVAPFALVAGSACTIAMLKGEDGADWLRGMDLPALWMDEAGSVLRHRPDSVAACIE